MKIYFKLFFVFVLFTISFSFVNAYNASDVIGQNKSDGTPVWTTNIANNKANVSGMDMAINDPEGDMAVDTVHHRLFVNDSENNRVLVFNLNEDGTLVDHNADYVLGQPDFDTVDPGTTQSKFNYPWGLAYDSGNDRLFIADSFNNRVIIFDTTTITNGMNALYVIGQPDFTSNTSATTQNGLDVPIGLDYNPTDNYLFVVDDNNSRIMIFDVSTIINGENAINVIGQPNFTTLSYDVTQSGFSAPIDVAHDTINNRLFVTDVGANRVLVFDVSNITNGMNASYVIGQSDFTSGGSATTQNGLDRPQVVTYDSINNRIFVGEGNNNRIMIFDVSTIVNGENAMNVIGQPDFTSNTSATTQNGLNYPYGLGYDSINNFLYLGDCGNNRIMIFDTSEITNGENAVDVIGQNKSDGTPVWTTNQPNNAGNVVGSNAINDPEGDMAVDTVHHRLFINDSSNNRVLVFNLNEDGTLVDHNADYVLGQPDFDTVNEGLTQNKLYYPMGLAYDSINNRLFVSDDGNNRVMIFDVSTITNGEDAINVLGQPDFTTNEANSTQNGLASPMGLTHNPQNNYLFISDMDNNRVMIFDVSTITNGEDAINVLGQPDFTTNDANTTQNGFDYPENFTYDLINNHLYVGDYGNNRVMIFDVTTLSNNMNASHVIGQPDFTSNNFNTNQNSFGSGSVYGLNHDSNNNRLFVSDWENHRVMIFDVSTITNGEDAINVLGQNDFTTSDSAVSQSGLNGSAGLTYDSINNHVFINDGNNNRIMIFNLIKNTTDSLSNGTVGTSYSETLTSSGSQGEVTYEVSSGSLPEGITLTDDTLSGTPTTAGTYTFTIKANDTWTDEPTIEPFSDSKSYTIDIISSNTPTRHKSSGSSAIAMDTFQQEQAQRALDAGLTTPSTPSINILNLTRTLKYGMQGDDVKALQVYLNAHNYPVSLTGAGSLSNETTYFGLKTKQAVIKFQLANGLVGDGIVGKMTQAKLK